MHLCFGGSASEAAEYVEKMTDQETGYTERMSEKETGYAEKMSEREALSPPVA